MYKLNGGKLFFFLKQFILHPKQTSAIMPSSELLASKMIPIENILKATCIVELGPGTGIFTRKIINQINGGKVFFALEINLSFVVHLKRKFPNISIHEDSAENIEKYLQIHNKKFADIVISSLPWSSFTKQKQELILAEIIKNLKEGGEFITYSYIHTRIFPRSKYFKKLLQDYFSEVKISKIIWENIPPAVVYDCIK